MNKIEHVTKEKLELIKEAANRDPRVFVVELFGDRLPTEQQFMEATIEAIQIPYPDCELKYGWYNDYLNDLLWIKEPNIVMLVHDYNAILKDDPKIKQWWIEDLEEIILPWWDGEVMGHMVGGYPRGFNVYMETAALDKGECDDEAPQGGRRIGAEAAKELFMKYDGSTYAMVRESCTAFREYLTAEISAEQETLWRAERLPQILSDFEKSGTCEDFLRLYSLADTVHSEEAWALIRQALPWLRLQDKEELVECCEEIMGRGYNEIRGGYIFWTYDSGKKEGALRVVDWISERLASIRTDDEDIKLRLILDQEELQRRKAAITD